MDHWVDAERLATKAAELCEAGRFEEAERSLQAAIEIDGEQPEWHHQMGIILHVTSRHREAVASFDRASELSPSTTQFLEAAAAACGATGDHAAAASRLERLARLDRDNPTRWAQLIEAQAASGHHDEAEASFYLAEMQCEGPHAAVLTAIGGSLAVRGVHPRAIWCFQEAIRLDPAFALAHRRLAEVHALTGDLSKALTTYERFIDANAVDPETALSWAGLLVEAGRLRQGGEVARRVLDADPVNAHAHFVLGEIAMRRGHFEQAAQTLQLVRRLDRDHVQGTRSLARCLIHLGQIGDARRLLSRAVKASERSDGRPADLMELGGLLVDGGMPEEAASVFERAVAAEESVDLAALRLLAKARYLAGDIDGGRAISRRVLRRDPGCVASLANLARASLKVGQLAESSGWLRRGLAAHPEDEGLRGLRWRLGVARAARVLKRLVGAS